jgi:hypothetical protein
MRNVSAAWLSVASGATGASPFAWRARARRDHRQCADDHGVIGESVVGAQASGRGAKAIDHRKAFGCREQLGQADKRAAAAFAEPGADFGLGDRRAATRRPQPRGDAFESGRAGEAADVVARDNQLAFFAVHMAQGCFGGGDSVEPDGCFSLDGHGRSLFAALHKRSCHLRY